MPAETVSDGPETSLGWNLSPEAQETRRIIRKTAYQATRLQELAFEGAEGLKADLSSEKEDTRSRARAQVVNLVRAWDTAVERLRILRGKPLPGQFKPERPAKPKRSQPTVLPPL